MAGLVSEFDRDVLDLLKEECAEVVQAASKVVRFGADTVNPFATKADQKPNGQLLEDEIGDVLAIAQLLAERGLIDFTRIYARTEWKRGMLREHQSLDAYKAEVLTAAEVCALRDGMRITVTWMQQGSVLQHYQVQYCGGVPWAAICTDGEPIMVEPLIEWGGRGAVTLANVRQGWL